jgi:hypothetical protein
MGSGGRLLIGLGAVALIVVLFFVIRSVAGEDENAAATTAAEETGTADPTTEPGTTEPGTTAPPAPPPPAGPREIRVNIPAGGPTEIQRATVARDDEVVLIVRSALSDHVHVHGYDLLADVGPGQPARITFRATDPGRFEIELEDRAVPIVDLRVTP